MHHSVASMLALVTVAVAAPAGHAQTGSLIRPGADVQTVAEGFTFAEGPAADADGNVYFTDIPEDLIYVIDTAGTLTTFVEQSNGANGLFFDRQGRLYACEGGPGQIGRLDSQGHSTPLVATYQGTRFNRPNDLWVDSRGGVYFSDPWGIPGQPDAEPPPQGANYVYYLPAGAADAIRVDEIAFPNGVIGTSDDSTLYVADTFGAIYVYDIDGPGRTSNKRLFVMQRSDGLTLDERGNLYITTGGEVIVYAADGAELERIAFPEGVSNMTFGGPSHDVLYATGRSALYTLQMNVRGMY